MTGLRVRELATVVRVVFNDETGGDVVGSEPRRTILQAMELSDIIRRHPEYPRVRPALMLLTDATVDAVLEHGGWLDRLPDKVQAIEETLGDLVAA